MNNWQNVMDAWDHFQDELSVFEDEYPVSEVYDCATAVDEELTKCKRFFDSFENTLSYEEKINGAFWKV